MSVDVYFEEAAQRFETVYWYESGSPKGWRYTCPLHGDIRDDSGYTAEEVSLRHRHCGVRMPGGPRKIRPRSALGVRLKTKRRRTA